jgi:hypothetical protein
VCRGENCFKFERSGEIAFLEHKRDPKLQGSKEINQRSEIFETLKSSKSGRNHKLRRRSIAAVRSAAEEGIKSIESHIQTPRRVHRRRSDLDHRI